MVSFVLALIVVILDNEVDHFFKVTVVSGRAWCRARLVRLRLNNVVAEGIGQGHLVDS